MLPVVVTSSIPTGVPCSPFYITIGTNDCLRMYWCHFVKNLAMKVLIYRPLREREILTPVHRTVCDNGLVEAVTVQGTESDELNIIVYVHSCVAIPCARLIVSPRFPPAGCVVSIRTMLGQRLTSLTRYIKRTASKTTTITSAAACVPDTTLLSRRFAGNTKPNTFVTQLQHVHCFSLQALHHHPYR